jgi:raffinose/stachyose/melibiose transport system permease protein
VTDVLHDRTGRAVGSPGRAPSPRPRRSRGPRGGAVPRAATSALLWGYAAVAVAPLLIMVAGSLRPTAELYSEPLAPPWPLTFDGYTSAWTEASFGSYFVNSLLVTGGAVLLSTAVATLAAYGLARCRSRVLQGIEALFLSGLMLPIHLAILPVFYLLDSLGLVDTRPGLLLVYAAAGVPFSVFVLTAFFRQLPLELEEAARIDGAGPFTTFWRIMLPLVRPAMATVIVFRFVPVWNDFLYPLVLMRSTDRYTLPVGLTSFFGEYQTDWSTLFAGLVIATAPLVILFLVATKQIVAGLTAGMTK